MHTSDRGRREKTGIHVQSVHGSGERCILRTGEGGKRPEYMFKVCTTRREMHTSGRGRGEKAGIHVQSVHGPGGTCTLRAGKGQGKAEGNQCGAERLRLTMNTPENTSRAARTFCQVRISIPMMMLMTVAMIGWM